MAQLVEQRIRNAPVGGSSPPGGSSHYGIKTLGFFQAFFYFASWNEMKEAKAKGLDVPSFYLGSLK